MSHLHHDQVIFEFSFENLHNALKYPDSFPYLSDFFSQLQSLLQGQVSWCLRFAPPSENSVASTIANSVVCDLRLQSYVASQGPSWLSSLIDKEATPWPSPRPPPYLSSSLDCCHLLMFQFFILPFSIPFSIYYFCTIFFLSSCNGL